jgi:hypothetical protein
MHGAGGQPNPLIGYIIMAVVLSVVLLIRFRRMNKSRPLKVEQLWIVPTLYLVVAVIAFATTPPSAAGWAGSIIACALGGALGWQRGRLMRIEVDPESHDVTMVQSPAAFLFIVVLIAIRSGLRGAAQNEVVNFLHMSPASITDILVAFALGLLAVQRLEMFLRARRLLEEARRHRPA